MRVAPSLFCTKRYALTEMTRLQVLADGPRPRPDSFAGSLALAVCGLAAVLFLWAQLVMIVGVVAACSLVGGVAFAGVAVFASERRSARRGTVVFDDRAALWQACADGASAVETIAIAPHRQWLLTDEVGRSRALLMSLGGDSFGLLQGDVMRHVTPDRSPRSWYVERVPESHTLLKAVACAEPVPVERVAVLERAWLDRLGACERLEVGDLPTPLLDDIGWGCSGPYRG